MDTQKITDNITLIKGKNRGKFPFSHSFLIEDDITALIDTGCGIETLKTLKRKIDKINVVINSHSHPDHTAGNWVFSGIPLRVPYEEMDFNSNINMLSERYAGKELARTWRDFVSQRMDFRDAHPTETFHNGDVLEFGNTAFEAVHTPGHAVGHYCFFERNDNILFSFDIDFTKFGPWYGNVESDIKYFKKSVEKVRALNPDVVVSSHRGIVKGNIEKEFDRFLSVFKEREERIIEFLEQERTYEEIVDEALIYRNFSFHPVLLRYWEGVMVRKHLDELINKGIVVKTQKGFLKK